MFKVKFILEKWAFAAAFGMFKAVQVQVLNLEQFKHLITSGYTS